MAPKTPASPPRLLVSLDIIGIEDNVLKMFALVHLDAELRKRIALARKHLKQHDYSHIAISPRLTQVFPAMDEDLRRIVVNTSVLEESPLPLSYGNGLRVLQALRAECLSNRTITDYMSTFYTVLIVQPADLFIEVIDGNGYTYQTRPDVCRLEVTDGPDQYQEAAFGTVVSFE